jgi:hypothetical protein
LFCSRKRAWNEVCCAEADGFGSRRRTRHPGRLLIAANNLFWRVFRLVE